MYVSALTLKGFKSFASSTTLRFEPGMTCVVGPNGSGKSNVVDAVAWVLGEQGARSLRGGSMADVIFAGTPGRAPLGRAEVSVTFDNGDGSIPEGAGEVTVTRTMFRSGGSEYAINGRSCRLLDIQDMLGDAGLGRELHVLVGQGRVDAVLAATPQERRLFLEEAAGVAKHRRRKEKALRKLAAMDGNLVRLADLTAEVARQLKPLGRQARTARRARHYAAEARDARLRLLADDVSAAMSALAAMDPEDGVGTPQRLAAVEAQLADAETTRRQADAELAAVAPAVSGWRVAAGRSRAVHERLRTVVRLAEDRLRILGDTSSVSTGPDPQRAEDAARAAREEAERLAAEVTVAQDAVRERARVRADVEQAHAAAERIVAERERARARARDEVARRRADVATAQARVESTAAEERRLAQALDEALERRDLAVAEADGSDAAADAAPVSAAPVSADSVDAGPVDAGPAEADEPSPADPAVTAAAAADARQAHERAGAVHAAAVAAERAADTELAAAEARETALGSLAAHDDGVAAVTARHPSARPVAECLDVAPGLEAAVAAALGEAAEGLALPDPEEALAAVREATRRGAGRVTLVVPPAVEAAVGDGERAELAEAVRGTGAVAGWARARLRGVALAATLDEAAEHVRVGDHQAVAVTPDGEVVAADTVRGGRGDGVAALRRQNELAEARDAVAATREHAESCRAATATARAAADRAADALRAAEDQHREATVRAAAAAERSAARRARVAQADAEVARTRAAVEAATRRREELLADVDRRTAALGVAEDRAAQLAADPAGDGDHAGDAGPEGDHGPDGRRADGARPAGRVEGDVTDPTVLAERAREAREAETAARVTARALEERRLAAEQRAAAAGSSAEAARAALLASQEEDRRRHAARESATGVHVEAGEAVQEALRVRTVTADTLQRHTAAHDEAAARLAAAAREVERLAEERARLADALHAEELARTERRLRLDSLAETASQEHGYAVADLVAEYGPQLPVPVTRPPEGDEPADPAPEATAPYDRAEQSRRLKAAERGLAALGTVNPLAMEEYAALEERHRFLLQQQQDLTDSKRDLLAIIKDVDEKVEQVVGEAFADTARHFADIVPRLFPGGSGRLVLTDPDDLLAAGIEVEAKPAGKTVKRLSLLSGGERTLVALAFLVALFRARPSPFYVLDEIEAALDENNLQRLLVVLQELRESSQLIVVTHQRRTMEDADALYGVTMRDGVTTVISQRMRGSESAA